MLPTIITVIGALTVCIAVVPLFLILLLAWRLASRHHSLPCPVWLRWLVELDNPFSGVNRADAIVRSLNLEPGMQVLDVGCGPGRLTIPIARQIGPQGRVTAVDIQAGMLRRAEKKARAAQLGNVRFLLLAVGEGRLTHDEYDRALLVTVLGEVPDREGALREIFNALKSGGILLVSEIALDPHFQTRSSILKLCDAVGYREVGFVGNSLAFIMLLQKR